jgi:hypothetical protein
MIEFLPIESIDSIERYPNYLAVFWDDTDIQSDDFEPLCCLLHNVKGLGALKKLNWTRYKKLTKITKDYTRTIGFVNSAGQRVEVEFNPIEDKIGKVLDGISPFLEVHCIRDIKYNKPITYIFFAKNLETYKQALNDLKTAVELLITDKKLLEEAVRKGYPHIASISPTSMVKPVILPKNSHI